MNIRAKAKIREFLQLNHSTPFHPDYLHRHLDLPIEVVNEECEALIEEGAVTRPLHTHYVKGVKVDWAARVASRKHLVTLFDRQRRIDLLWELFLVGMLVLLTFVLFAGAVH